ncbi:MAG: CHASE2 domain-containing protein, partial [Hyphomonadaceae bacterium]
MREVARATGRFLRAHAILILACCALALTYATAALSPLDEALAELRSRLISRAPTGDLVIVEIDARSLREAQQWPWPRERFARAITNLRNAGAGVIGFDVDFSVRSSPGDDEAMRTAMELDPGSVILPTFLQRSGEQNSPLAALSAHAVIGSVNIPIDTDGRVRRYYRGFQRNDDYFASLAAALAGAAYGQTRPFVIDYGIRSDRFARLSFQDVLANSFDPALVRGKTILVGSTALELGDEFATPMNPTLPGVYIHALAFESMVQGRALTHIRDELMLVLAVFALLVLWPRRAPLVLSRVMTLHVSVFSAVILGSILIQSIAPVSLNVGLILLAQLLCVAASINFELTHRAAELVRQREAHLTFVALHDPETELPNRRAMLQALAHELSADSRYVAAVAIRIERFSTLRGAIGYGNANQLVRSVCTRLDDQLGGPKCFQISTSILGAVLTLPDQSAAHRLCAEGLAGVDSTVRLNGQDIDISLRTGAAAAEAGATTAEILLERATLALDDAVLKRRRHVGYDGSDIVDPSLQLALLSDVGRGIRRGDFFIAYQAKAKIRGERTVMGAEALLRWRHPTHGPISPQQFIPVAEETGAVDELTCWVLRQVVQDQAKLRARGIDQCISINISGRSLCDEQFCASAIDIVHGCESSVCFEVTETAIIEDPAAAISAISAFRAAGIRISIDDYGSGLSSLAYLKQIAADE